MPIPFNHLDFEIVDSVHIICRYKFKKKLSKVVMLILNHKILTSPQLLKKQYNSISDKQRTGIRSVSKQVDPVTQRRERNPTRIQGVAGCLSGNPGVCPCTMDGITLPILNGQ